MPHFNRCTGNAQEQETPGRKVERKSAEGGYYLTYSVVTVWIWVCVLNPEILILPTTPEPFYFIVIIGICIGIKPTMKNREG